MPTNYSLGKIYKIECMTTKLIYYGSTCEPTLSRRLAAHKGQFNQFKKNRRQFCSSFMVLNNENYEITLVETIPCISRDELNTREKYYIKNNDCVNMVYNNNKSIGDVQVFRDSFPPPLLKYNAYNQDDINEMITANTTYRERILVK